MNNPYFDFIAKGGPFTIYNQSTSPKTIWKYPITDGGILDVPEGSKLLSVQAQGDSICAWLLVDPKMSIKPHKIKIIGTGWDARDMSRLVYMATVQQGDFVWHIFEEI